MPSQKLQFMLCNLTVATWSETVEKSVCVSGRNYVVSLDMCVCVYQFVNYIAHHFVRPPEKKNRLTQICKETKARRKTSQLLILHLVFRASSRCQLHVALCGFGARASTTSQLRCERSVRCWWKRLCAFRVIKTVILFSTVITFIQCERTSK